MKNKPDPRIEEALKKLDQLTEVGVSSMKRIVIKELFQQELQLARDEVRKQAVDLIKTEIDCIRSGNALTPSEMDIAIRTAKNIKARLEE